MIAKPPFGLTLYALVNAAFLVVLGVGVAATAFPDPRLLYLILLFALCSHVLIDLDGFNGRFALLALFMLVYMVSYGVGDFSNIFSGIGAEVVPRQRDSIGISTPEMLILAGGVTLVFGYRLAVYLAPPRGTARTAREWSTRSILTVGGLFWVIGTVATYRWDVYIVPDTTNDAVRKGLASISTATATLYILGQMCQPLGILLLAYAHSVMRSRLLLAVIIVIVVLQVFIGFVVDIKGLAMLGGILVVSTALLVDGRLPKAWLAAGVLFVIFVFPVFQAYRSAIHGERGIARTAVVANFGHVLELTLAATQKVNSGRERAQTFLERGSVKGSLETIVQETGNGVEFQRGHTLLPILAAFVPKIVWSDKLSVPTGQLVNKEFHISDSEDVWISPSHLGELYWNFGWTGALIGMGVIGLICGTVGARCNAAEYLTVTRVLVTVTTIKLLIVGFEGGLGDIYVVWLRSLAGIGLMHVLFARVTVFSRLAEARGDVTQPSMTREATPRPFSNLLS